MGLSTIALEPSQGQRTGAPFDDHREWVGVLRRANEGRRATAVVTMRNAGHRRHGGGIDVDRSSMKLKVKDQVVGTWCLAAPVLVATLTGSRTPRRT